MFSGCPSVSACVRPCARARVLLARLSYKAMDAISPDFSYWCSWGTDELIRFWRSWGQGQGGHKVKYLNELLRRAKASWHPHRVSPSCQLHCSRPPTDLLSIEWCEIQTFHFDLKAVPCVSRQPLSISSTANLRKTCLISLPSGFAFRSIICLSVTLVTV